MHLQRTKTECECSLLMSQLQLIATGMRQNKGLQDCETLLDFLICSMANDGPHF